MDSALIIITFWSVSLGLQNVSRTIRGSFLAQPIALIAGVLYISGAIFSYSHYGLLGPFGYVVGSFAFAGMAGYVVNWYRYH